MKKMNRKIRWIACLLCVLTLVSAFPLFPLNVSAEAAPTYEWGYTGTDIVAGTTDTIAGAGTVDVAWIRGGCYQAISGNKTIKADGDFSYTEGIIVYPGMKLWWTDPTDPAGHGDAAAVKFWTDATFTTLISGTNDFMGTREGAVAGEGWVFSTGGTTATDGTQYHGMLMQNKKGENGICYTYWNHTNAIKYVTLSYKGRDAVPIYYSAGEPQLIGEDNAPLPRMKLNVSWTEDTRYRVNATTGALSLESYPTENGTKTGTTGYVLSSVITLKPGQTIALFGDRALNGQTGADSQVIESENPTCVFAAFSNKDTRNNSTRVAAVSIGDAKINKGAINNTGVVVYQYTNATSSVQYVQVSYCCTDQRGWNATTKDVDYKPSNVYLYEDFSTYKAIRTNTQAVTGYFSSKGATTVNTTVVTPPAPSKTQGGVFFGWKVEYTRNSTAVKEYYPPETELVLTTNASNKKPTSEIASEIKMTPVYLDALPFTYEGASIRTLMPTGLQFKLYFRKSDFDKMKDEANATKGSLSIGAFAVPQSHMNYFLSGQYGVGITANKTTTALKNATLADADAKKIADNFTKEWFDDPTNEKHIRDYAKSVTGKEYTAPMYLDGRTEGSYVTIERINGVDYCVAYYTLAESHMYFNMDFTARAYLTIQYESYDANGEKTYKYSDPLYGEFETTNVRNTEEVILATLRDRGTDYAGIQYFTEDLADMQADVKAGGVKYGKWKFSKDGDPFESFTYYDPKESKKVTLYTRRFSGATLAEFARILKGTQYDPANH